MSTPWAKKTSLWVQSPLIQPLRSSARTVNGSANRHRHNECQRPVRDGGLPERSQAGEIGGRGVLLRQQRDYAVLDEARGQARGWHPSRPASASAHRRSVRARSVRLSPKPAHTISFMPVICGRVKRWPKNVVEGRPVCESQSLGVMLPEYRMPNRRIHVTGSLGCKQSRGISRWV